MAVLSLLFLMLMSMVASVSDRWVDSERTIQSNQNARAALELFTREITPAVVDTRMQFIVAPGKDLETVGAKDIATNSPAIFWMAPLGKNGELRCVGYYLYHNKRARHYQLKRIFIRAGNRDGYFPRVFDSKRVRSMDIRTDPVTARWFLDNWDSRAFDDRAAGNQKVVVSTVAEGVLAFWVQCLDTLGNPVPFVSESKHHLRSKLQFNSAAYFHMATTAPFDNGESFTYLKSTPSVMKAHQLPAEMEIAIITAGEEVTNRGFAVPVMENILNKNGSLDLQRSIESYLEKLEKARMNGAEVYTTRVKLSNGG